MTSSLWRRGRLLASSDNGPRRFAGTSSINVIVSRPGSWVRRRRETSRCVALTADVSEMCPCVQRTDNTKCLFAGTLWKPSDVLEPSTPSLPWRFRGGTGGHGRAFAITFSLQIGPVERVSGARACPRAPSLMYPSRTRAPLSVCKTSSGGQSGTGTMTKPPRPPRVSFVRRRRRRHSCSLLGS
jgi:hypothetical protein